MKKIQLIARNLGFLSLSQFISLILTLLYTIYIARYLGASNYGILSFAIAFTGIFSVCADLGLNMLTTREISRNNSLIGKYIGNIIIIKIILALLTFFAIVLVVNLIGYPIEIVYVVYLMGLSVICASFSGAFNSVFQASEKMGYQALGLILNNFLMFMGVLITIHFALNIIAFASLYLIVAAIVLVYSLIICFWRFTIPKLEVDLNFWTETILEALPFGLTSIFVLIYYYIDVLMLSFIVPNSNEIIGWYSAAYMLVTPLSFIPAIFFTSIFPSMSKLYLDSEDFLKFVFQKSIIYMIILGVPMAAGITILADKIFLIFYGPNYIPGIIALKILIWSVPLIFVDSAFSYLFSSINRQITVTKIMGIVACINIILNLILIPIFSYIGASIVMVLSDIFTLIIMCYILSNSIYKIPTTLLKKVSKVLVSTIVMVISIMILINLNIILIILIAAMIYIMILFLLKGLDKEDLFIIKLIFSKIY